jgi:hypothetical protein
VSRITAPSQPWRDFLNAFVIVAIAGLGLAAVVFVYPKYQNTNRPRITLISTNLKTGYKIRFRRHALLRLEGGRCVVPGTDLPHQSLLPEKTRGLQPRRDYPGSSAASRNRRRDVKEGKHEPNLAGTRLRSVRPLAQVHRALLAFALRKL